MVYDYVSYLKNDKTEFEKLQGQQYMALDERARRAEPVSEYASLNSSTSNWEIPTEHVTIEKIVGKGAFGQVAKATVIGLHGRLKKTLVSVKMLKGIKYFKWVLAFL